MTTWFLSDLHLRDINERNGNRLLRFLFELNKNPTEHQLFLLGDIFDLWIADGKTFTAPFQPLVDQIALFKKQGGKVVYFEGNHDVHIDHFWTRKYGIEVFDEMQFFKIGDLNVRVEHGDYINPDDKAYIQYLSIIRNPIIEKIGIQVPSWFWAYFAGKQSAKSRKRSSRYTIENSEKIRKMIRTYAEKKFSEKHFDLIVTGHMHVFDDYTFQVGAHHARSINLGTWLETPRVLKIMNNQIHFVILD